MLLRPAVTLPVEIYDAERVAEFAAAEEQLAEWYNRESTTGKTSDPEVDADNDQ